MFSGKMPAILRTRYDITVWSRDSRITQEPLANTLYPIVGPRHILRCHPWLTRSVIRCRFLGSLVQAKKVASAGRVGFRSRKGI